MTDETEPSELTGDQQPTEYAVLRFTRPQLDVLQRVMRMYKDQALAAGYEQSARDSIDLLTLFSHGYGQLRGNAGVSRQAKKKARKRANAARRAAETELLQLGRKSGGGVYVVCDRLLNPETNEHCEYDGRPPIDAEGYWRCPGCGARRRITKTGLAK